MGSHRVGHDEGRATTATVTPESGPADAAHSLGLLCSRAARAELKDLRCSASHPARPSACPTASHWRVSCPACPAGPAEGAGWAAGSISVSDVRGDMSLPVWKRCALSPDFLFASTRSAGCKRRAPGSVASVQGQPYPLRVRGHSGPCTRFYGHSLPASSLWTAEAKATLAS